MTSTQSPTGGNSHTTQCTTTTTRLIINKDLRKLMLQQLENDRLEKPLISVRELRSRIANDFPLPLASQLYSPSPSSHSSSPAIKRTTALLPHKNNKKLSNEKQTLKKHNHDRDDYRDEEEEDEFNFAEDDENDDDEEDDDGDDDDDDGDYTLHKKKNTQRQVKNKKKKKNTRNNGKNRMKSQERIIQNELLMQKKVNSVRFARFFNPLTVSPSNYKSSSLLLKDYQLKGLNWLRKNWYARRNCVLADEMGLGKTIQSIALIHYIYKRYGIDGPFLIVVPLSTLANWQRELNTWTTMNVKVMYTGSVSNDDDDDENVDLNIVLTTYETLKSQVRYFRKKTWQVVIYDEAHKLKSPHTKIRRTVEKLPALHSVLLTGTPFQVNILELFHLLALCATDVFSNPDVFLEKFGELNNEEQVVELRKLIGPFVLRRTKDEVLAEEMPPKEEVIVELELTNLQKTLYRAIIERKSEFLRREYKTNEGMSQVIFSIKKCCNHPFLIQGVEKYLHGKEPEVPIEQLMIKCSSKLIFIDKLLSQVVEKQEKVLIFCQMLDMLSILEDYLAYKKIKYVRLDGSTNNEERTAHIDEFSTESEVRVFLLSTRAGGLGINLVSANHAILFDSDFNPFNDTQASARCHRIGQTKKVMVYRLITKNTYEMYVLKKASKRLGIGEVILGTQKRKEEVDLTSVNEMNNMLKYGVYHLFLKGSEGEDLMNQNLDTILSKSKVVNTERETGIVSIFSGGEDQTEAPAPAPATSTDRQATDQVTSLYFLPDEEADQELDINGEKFWEKVFPEYTDAPTLEYRLDDQEPFAVNEMVQFITQFKRLVQDVLYDGNPLPGTSTGDEEIFSGVNLLEEKKSSHKDAQNSHQRKSQLHTLMLKMVSPQSNPHYHEFTHTDMQFVQSMIDSHYSGRMLRKGKVTRNATPLPANLTTEFGSPLFSQQNTSVFDDSDEEFLPDEVDEEFMNKKQIEGYGLKQNKKASSKLQKSNLKSILTKASTSNQLTTHTTGSSSKTSASTSGSNKRKAAPQPAQAEQPLLVIKKRRTCPPLPKVYPTLFPHESGAVNLNDFETTSLTNQDALTDGPTRYKTPYSDSFSSVIAPDLCDPGTVICQNTTGIKGTKRRARSRYAPLVGVSAANTTAASSSTATTLSHPPQNIQQPVPAAASTTTQQYGPARHGSMQSSIFDFVRRESLTTAHQPQQHQHQLQAVHLYNAMLQPTNLLVPTTAHVQPTQSIQTTTQPIHSTQPQGHTSIHSTQQPNGNNGNQQYIQILVDTFRRESDKNKRVAMIKRYPELASFLQNFQTRQQQQRQWQFHQQNPQQRQEQPNLQQVQQQQTNQQQPIQQPSNQSNVQQPQATRSAYFHFQVAPTHPQQQQLTTAQANNQHVHLSPHQQYILQQQSALQAAQQAPPLQKNPQQHQQQQLFNQKENAPSSRGTEVIEID